MMIIIKIIIIIIIMTVIIIMTIITRYNSNLLKLINRALDSLSVQFDGISFTVFTTLTRSRIGHDLIETNLSFS